MEINTHGRNISMEDLAKASDYTRGLGSRTGEYAEIFYDKTTGEVWGAYHWDREEWTVYHDADVIKVGITTRYKTQQQIADMIADAMADYEQTERENAEYLRGGVWA